jgi:two-component system sensor histidine kinase KdpD
MTSERPDPDELLARVQVEEDRAQRGKLKLFLGYAAGVGKTFEMLQEARRQKAAGVDVVVGYVEPHGRPETEALLEGLEAIPPRRVPHRGVTVRELDLDAVLKRRPQLVLIDELAHTNAEGLRHTKRWHDVEEILAAGIDVYTTLNVQHLESLNDVIAQITGVVVRETLPDAVLEKCDDLELIDITPEELIQRLQAGKVYIPQQAERALRHFFQKSNLHALRELSLRQAASRVGRDVEAARRGKAAGVPWATAERLLVCVGPSPTSAKLIRSAKRMASAFEAPWLAVTVETRGAEGQSSRVRHEIARHLQLAEELGAETHTLVGADVAETILEYARGRNVTKIVVGKTQRPWWTRWVAGDVITRLLDRAGDIDIYVIRGEGEEPERTRPPAVSQAINWADYLHTAAAIAVCGLIGWLLQRWGGAANLVNIAMVFLAGIAYVAGRVGRGPAIAASVAGVLVFDFFFVPPSLTFAVTDTRYVFTFAVMLAIGLLISELTARLKDRLRASQQLERRTAALLGLTKQLSELIGIEFLVRTAGQRLSELFAGEVVIYLREAEGKVALRCGERTSIPREPVNALVAQWVIDHNQIAGFGTDTLPNATALFVPMTGSQRTVGALGVKPTDADRFLDPEQRRLLETCASLIALAVERDQSLLEAHEAQLEARTEQFRSSLLSSVSHDLRTPLATIAGAATGLLEPAGIQDETTREELLHSIAEESLRLSRLVDNLLDMTRLESGAVKLNLQWHVLEELVGSALGRLRRELKSHTVRTVIPHELPLIHVDGALFEQVLVNLLDNAVRYTPPGSAIEITSRAVALAQAAQAVEIRIADNGPGLPPGPEDKVFDKFFRGAPATPDARRGVGLGLSICRSIVQAHGGQISARNRSGGGAEFIVVLPCKHQSPQVRVEDTQLTASAVE